MGPSTSNPFPADQEQSVAAKRRPPSFRSARHALARLREIADPYQ